MPLASGPLHVTPAFQQMPELGCGASEPGWVSQYSVFASSVKYEKPPGACTEHSTSSVTMAIARIAPSRKNGLLNAPHSGCSEQPSLPGSFQHASGLIACSIDSSCAS